MPDRREDRERRGWRSDMEGEDRGYGWRGNPTNPYDVRYGEDMAYDRGGYGGDYARDYPHDYGRDYGRGGVNRDYSRSYGRDYDRDYTQGDWRFGSGRDTNLENFGQRSSFERDFEEEDWENEDEPVYWMYEEWWMVPGPFTGVGPRDYQRPDERIFEDVCERLTQHGQIDASDMEVAIENGEVTLQGQVDNRRTKRLVEDIIDDIPGVVDIHNQLRVRQDNRMASRGQSNTVRGSSFSQNRIHEGMQIVGSDGVSVGKVKEIREHDFLADRPMARDVYIPFDAVARADNQVILNIRADEVSSQNWPAPPLFKTTETPGQEGGQSS